MPLVGDKNSIASAYWEALNKENRVALAVKFIMMSGQDSWITVINKFAKIG